MSQACRLQAEVGGVLLERQLDLRAHGVARYTRGCVGGQQASEVGLQAQQSAPELVEPERRARQELGQHSPPHAVPAAGELADQLAALVGSAAELGGQCQQEEQVDVAVMVGAAGVWGKVVAQELVVVVEPLGEQ